MTQAEKQNYERCRRNPKDHDCTSYTADALRKHGIDPSS
jgi:hypothetical protein